MQFILLFNPNSEFSGKVKTTMYETTFDKSYVKLTNLKLTRVSFSFHHGSPWHILPCFGTRNSPGARVSFLALHV